uniref:Uncharacterized protein n=1 Tax=Biomphalaria glabrata TaxID=6526 RepID=A0A2C9KTJ9_BIOGL
MTCIRRRCGCQSGYYYNTTRQGCHSALKRGQLCDPSTEKMCEFPDLICAREKTSTASYTCQQNQNTNDPDFQENTSEDNSNTGIIAVAVVGWVAAPAAVIIVFVICSRNRKKSLSEGILETQSVQGTIASKSSPKTADLQSTTNLSPPEIADMLSKVCALDGPNMKPNIFTKSLTSANTDLPIGKSTSASGHSKMYTYDSPDSLEHTYDVINTVQFLADTNDDAYEKVIQNVRTPQENDYDNSNI